MPAFRVTGTFRMGGEWQRFTKEISATGEEDARHALLSDIGSKHGLARRLIRIKLIAPLQLDEVTDPVVRYKVARA